MCVFSIISLITGILSSLKSQLPEKFIDYPFFFSFLIGKQWTLETLYILTQKHNI